MIDYESDYDDMEEVPHIQLELDIRDVCQIYRALDFHEKNGNIVDEGTFIGINKDGSLLLQGIDDLKTYHFGEISILGVY